MGCHTWFNRPITKEEVDALIPLAYQNLEKERNDPEYPLEDEFYYDWKKQLDKGDIELTCQLGCTKNQVSIIQGKPYLDCCNIYEEGPFKASDEHFHDNFRIGNYPRKIIRSKRQLRRYLRARWYEIITPEISAELSKFWKLYPGGVIEFG